MDPNTNFFHAISPFLPEKVLQGLRSSPVDESALDNLVRLLSGSICSPQSTQDIRDSWTAAQASITSTIPNITSSSSNKRSLEPEDTEDTNSKRARISPPEESNPAADTVSGVLLFSLQPISTTSPVRKKTDMTIRENTLVLVNAMTKSTDTPPIPLSSLKRAFLLPTRGKTKPHWTVVLLSSDSQSPSRGKQPKGSSDDNPQVIFGLDAKLTTAITTISYDSDGNPTPTIHSKGSNTLPILKEFLQHLRIPVLEPNASIFKSAVPGLGKNANPNGVPGIEAYRAAKPGSLWFMREGILWGESKPCEFWSVEDLIGRVEGLRIIGGAGKTCSVLLTRRSRATVGNPKEKDPGSNEEEEKDPGSNEEEEKDYGEETEFSMIDAKEKGAIEQWVQRYRNTFGSGQEETSVTTEKKSLPQRPVTIHQLAAESDSEDEDFVDSDDDSSTHSANSSDSEEDAQGSDDKGKEDREDGENPETSLEGESTRAESEEELDPKHHPLLRTGLPKMSKAAIDMAVAMVVDDLAGESDEEVDELEE